MREYIWQVTAVLNQCNVAVYPVVAASGRGTALAPLLEQTAALTGGRLSLDGVGEALRQAAVDVRPRWVLRYNSARRSPDKYCKIRATCTHPGVRLLTEQEWHDDPFPNGQVR